MFDLILARLVHSTRPPRDRHATVGNSLLDASATMAKVEVELHPAVAVAIGLGLSFYASLDASLDGNGGVTPKARAERCDRVRTFSTFYRRSLLSTDGGLAERYL